MWRITVAAATSLVDAYSRVRSLTAWSPITGKGIAAKRDFTGTTSTRDALRFLSALSLHEADSPPPQPYSIGPRANTRPVASSTRYSIEIRRPAR